MPELSPQDIEKQNRINHMVETLSGDGVYNDGHSIRIAWPSQARRPVVIPSGMELLRLTSNATGLGTYNARRQKIIETTGNSEDDLDFETDYADLHSTDDAVYLNANENNNPSETHALYVGASTFVVGMVSKRVSDDSPARPIYIGDTPRVCCFPVTLAQYTGGTSADGTATTPPTWTYNVTDALTGATIGTNITPKQNRPNGKTKKAAIGMCYYDTSATLILQWCDEVDNTNTCS
jgi:hypothetical protein